MRISRRKLLAGTGAVVAFARPASAQTPAPVTELRAQAVDLQLLAAGGGETRAWRFTTAGQVVDVLRATQGQELRLRLFNDLDVEVWLHWFGVRGPDGMMTINIPPHTEEGVECVFTPPDAGTFWFGPVVDVSRQRDMGLYGMLVVEAAGDQRFHDLPLVIDDWKLGDDGQIVQGFGDLQLAIGEGRLGNWFTANTQYAAVFKAPANRIVRLRVLNAANTRSISLQFKGPVPWLAALDGNAVPAAPVGEASLALAPGQRADLLLDPARDELTIGLDLFEDVVELCHIVREGEAGGEPVQAGTLINSSAASGVPDLAAAKLVPVIIEGGAKGGLQRAKVNGVETDIKGLVEQGKAWAINGEAGLAGASLGAFAMGETILLEIDNRTAFPQAVHIHGHAWLQLTEAGAPPAAVQPRRDTAVIASKSSQKLVFIADNPGLWMLQSLVAERCDSGLISTFRVG